MDLRTAVTHSNPPSHHLRLRERSPLMIRPSLQMQLMRHLNGWTPTSLQRRRNSRRSKRLLKQLLPLSFKPWEVEQLLEVCQVACLTWEEQQVEHLLLRIPRAAPPLRRLIKHKESSRKKS